MIITTKNNEVYMIDSDEDFKELVYNEIGEDARECVSEMIVGNDEYVSLANDYDELIEENNQLETQIEGLKYKLEMIEQGKDKEYFNTKVWRIIREVKELEKVSKSQKVLSVEDRIIHMLKDMIIE